MFVTRALAAALLFCIAAPATAATLSPEAEAGRALFFDPNLSEPKGQSCASCHQPDRAFTGNAGSSVPGIAAGAAPHAMGTRKVPTLLYAAFIPPFHITNELNEKGVIERNPAGGFFWDGRADSLQDQASGPMLNPVEMNNPDAATILAKIKSAPYADQLLKAYGPEALKDPQTALKTITSAIAAFETTAQFMPFNSKFDAVLKGQEQFTAEEARGFALFKNKKKGNCLACHAGNEDSKDPTDWPFTDYTYDNLSTPRNMAIPANQEPTTFDLGLCKRPNTAGALPKETKLDSLCGAFKVPTLRNVEVTAPYFHNASIATLRDAVKFYATRDTDPAAWYPKDAKGKVLKFNDLPAQYAKNINTDEVPYDRKLGQKPRLNDAEIDALVAFLKTLTDRPVR